ncbi:MAG: hypothetical protein P1P86_08525 [Bacteroidales bacterium]|nr:hypothetical protein [Bacteroidales bacterium]
MKKPALLITGAIFLIAVSGCTSVKRFRTAEFKGMDNHLADVELFNASLSAEPAAIQEKNLWSLSANAQARLVQILDERYPDNEQFMSAMAGTYGSAMFPVEDYTRKDLRMVFTISKSRDYAKLNDAGERFSPADRIEYLRLSLEIPEDYGLRFLEWNRYSTEYGEIDIADVSFSRNLDLSVEGSPASLDVGSEAALGRNEKQVVSKRYLKLNGSISDHKAVIESEGTRELDLTGNVIADVSLAFAGFPELIVVPVFVDSGEAAGREKVLALKFVDVLVPAMEDAPDTLFAELSMEYIYRHVQSGWKTFAEWDDGVEYYQGSIRKRVPLFLKKDYLPRLYCIGSDLGEKKTLKFRTGTDREYQLQFMDRGDAGRFLQWLEDPLQRQTEPVYIGSNELLYKGIPLTPGELIRNRLKVMPVY